LYPKPYKQPIYEINNFVIISYITPHLLKAI